MTFPQQKVQQFQKNEFFYQERGYALPNDIQGGCYMDYNLKKYKDSRFVPLMDSEDLPKQLGLSVY